MASRRPNFKFLNRLEIRTRARMKRLLDEQMEWIIRNADSLTQWRAETNAMSDTEIEQFLLDMPNQERIAEEVIIASSAALNKGGKYIVKKVGLGEFGISFSLKNQDAIRFLGKKLSHELSSFKGNINGTTVKNIVRIIKDGAEVGDSYSVVARRIRKQGDVGVFSKARAEMIAVREVAVGYETGNNIPIKQFKALNPTRIVKKFWQTVEDDRVTATHRANQSQGWIDEEATFSATGDKHAPGSDNPRCRCFTKYDILAPNN